MVLMSQFLSHPPNVLYSHSDLAFWLDHVTYLANDVLANNVKGSLKKYFPYSLHSFASLPS